MYKRFALSLRVIIRKKDWQDQELAKELDVEKSTVSRHGSKTPLFSEHFLSCQEQDRKC